MWILSPGTNYPRTRCCSQIWSEGIPNHIWEVLQQQIPLFINNDIHRIKWHSQEPLLAPPHGYWGYRHFQAQQKPMLWGEISNTSRWAYALCDGMGDLSAKLSWEACEFSRWASAQGCWWWMLKWELRLQYGRDLKRPLGAFLRQHFICLRPITKAFLPSAYSLFQHREQEKVSHSSYQNKISRIHRSCPYDIRVMQSWYSVPQAL